MHLARRTVFLLRQSHGKSGPNTPQSVGTVEWKGVARTHTTLFSSPQQTGSTFGVAKGMQFIVEGTRDAFSLPHSTYNGEACRPGPNQLVPPPNPALFTTYTAFNFFGALRFLTPALLSPRSSFFSSAHFLPQASTAQLEPSNLFLAVLIAFSFTVHSPLLKLISFGGM